MSGREDRQKIRKGFLLALILPFLILMIGISLLRIEYPIISIILIYIGGIFSGIIIAAMFIILIAIRIFYAAIPDKLVEEKNDDLLIKIEKGEISGNLINTDYKINLIVVHQLPHNSICMISKTNLEDEKNALECNFCKNFFIPSYILEWLKVHDYCPVCRSLIK
ncbi:MAG: hypothetical protein FK731_01860 [Asgard group archaeon]|nr:hypothetical protein [Asgard group archaeon]